MTRKQRKWLAEYLKCWNATEAARRAGYKWPNKQGPANLKTLAAEVQAALDKAAMSADEALTRLAERARFDVGPYLKAAEEGGWRLDLEQLIADGHGRHIKSVKPTAHGDVVEFYDGQECLVLMAKHHGLLSDKVDLDAAGEINVVFSFADPVDEESDPNAVQD